MPISTADAKGEVDPLSEPASRRQSRRSHARPKEKTRSTASTAKKMEPTAPPEKACTESSTPLLVRKVPKMVREKERTISAQHHHLRAGIPVLGSSVWSRAVPVSQGNREAFSTGSHAQ